MDHRLLGCGATDRRVLVYELRCSMEGELRGWRECLFGLLGSTSFRISWRPYIFDFIVTFVPFGDTFHVLRGLDVEIPRASGVCFRYHKNGACRDRIQRGRLGLRYPGSRARSRMNILSNNFCDIYLSACLSITTNLSTSAGAAHRYRARSTLRKIGLATTTGPRG